MSDKANELFDVHPDWHDFRFRRAETIIGTIPPKCPGTCGYLMPRTKDEPLLVEWSRSRWDPKTKRLSDFTWPGGNQVLVTREVQTALATECSGLTFKIVSVTDSKRRRSRSKSPEKTSDTVELFQIVPKFEGELETSQMPGLKVTACAGCNRRWYDMTLCPRVVVKKQSVIGGDLFRLKDFTTVLFCNGHFQAVVERHQWTNILFKHRGVVA